MEVICQGRGTGKTYKLIKMSSTNWIPIVVSSYGQYKNIKDMANDMRILIPKPIIWDSEEFKHLNVQEVYVDDAEFIISKIFSYKVSAITISNNDGVNAFKGNFSKPKVVCLCGSTKFKESFIKLQEKLTLKGEIVLSAGVFAHADSIQITDEEKNKLDDLHKRKIDLCDYIFVLNVGGYIGESTKSEIEYAKINNKEIVYLESIWEE